MYESVLTGLGSILGSSSFRTAFTYPIVPFDYKESVGSNIFIKFKIITSKGERSAYQDNKKLSGMIVLSIFYPSGNGQKTPFQIASVLDTYLEDVRPTPQLHFGLSFLQDMGLDEDRSLSRSDYLLPFNYYGEF